MQLLSAFSLQSYAAVISFIVGAIIVGIVIFLVVTSNPEEDLPASKRVYKVRNFYFVGLLVVAAFALTFTLRALPYPSSDSSKVTHKVGVVAMQWAWIIGDGSLPQNLSEFRGTPKITLPSDVPIEFEVTARDVNHGFGIYNDRGEMVVQTQAMPGYVNRLIHSFEEGEYTILCMEYCGLPHGIMVSTIYITP